MERILPEAEVKKGARTAPPEVRRKQLIDATVTCVSKLGISGTTLTAVTKEAGLSLGLANFHFKNKETLLNETLNALAQEHRALWMKTHDREDLSPVAKLCAIVDAQFHPSICNRKKLAVWFAFFGETTHRKTYRQSSAHVDLERLEASTDLCHQIIADGGYTGVEAEDVASSLEALFDGFWLNILMYPVKFDREGASRQVFAYLESVFPKHF